MPTNVASKFRVTRKGGAAAVKRSRYRSSKQFAIKSFVLSQGWLYSYAFDCRLQVQLCDIQKTRGSKSWDNKSEIDKTSRSVESKTRRMSKFKLTFHFNSIDDASSGFHFLSCARKTQRGVVKELQAMSRCSFESNHFQMSGDA